MPELHLLISNFSLYYVQHAAFFNKAIYFIFGSIVTYYSMRLRDKNSDKDKLENEMHGLLSKVSFILAMQLSELVNIEMNLKNRLEKIDILTEDVSRDDMLQILQDFDVNFFEVNVEDIGNLMGFFINTKPISKIDGDKFQACFLSSKKYTNFINRLKTYNEMKREIMRDPKSDDPRKMLIAFLKMQIPNFLMATEREIKFIHNTIKSLEDLFSLIEKKTFHLGEVIRLPD